MKLLIILALCYSTYLFATERSIIINGVQSDNKEQLEKYLKTINTTLKNFGLPPQHNICENTCLDNSEHTEVKISASTIIYINEWLRHPGLCRNSKNRHYKEKVTSCFKRARENFKKSIPFIEAAATAFELNPNHLACLILQESQYLETAKSGTGPLGLAQISTGTLRTEKQIFKTTIPKSCDGMLSKQCSSIKNRRRRRQCYRDVAYCSGKVAIVAKKNLIQPDWQEYVKKVNPLLKKQQKLSSEYCKKDCRKDLYWSVGAAARYISEIINFDLGDLTLLKHPHVVDEKERFLMASGLYNPGPGFKNKLLKPLKKTTKFKAGWEKSIKPIWKNKKDVAKEPKKYITRIRSCIEYKLGDKLQLK